MLVKDELIYCACGCGKLINRYDKRGKERKYIKGHHNKGKSPKKETLDKIKKTKERLYKEGKIKVWNKGKTTKINKICEYCKKIFRCYPSNKDKKFCSFSCYKPKFNLKNKEDEILKLYTKEFLGYKTISKMMKIPWRQILTFLKERRAYSSILNRAKLKAQSNKCKLIKEKTDIDKIINFYINQRKNSYEIAKIYNCSNVNILNVLRRNGIKIRTSGESLIGVRKGIKQTSKHIENRTKSVKESYNKYPELRKLRAKIFRENFLNNPEKMKESARKTSETKKRLFKEGKIKGWNKGKTHLDDPRIVSGERIHTFNNWASREPYGRDFSPTLKKMIRQRDNLQCQECHKTKEEYGRKLDIHHIDYNKKNNSKINLIALCKKCHASTNSNREYWEKYFKKIMNSRFMKIEDFENKLNEIPIIK